MYTVRTYRFHTKAPPARATATRTYTRRQRRHNFANATETRNHQRICTQRATPVCCCSLQCAAKDDALLLPCCRVAVTHLISKLDSFQCDVGRSLHVALTHHTHTHTMMCADVAARLSSPRRTHARTFLSRAGRACSAYLIFTIVLLSSTMRNSPRLRRRRRSDTAVNIAAAARCHSLKPPAAYLLRRYIFHLRIDAVRNDSACSKFALNASISSWCGDKYSGMFAPEQQHNIPAVR